MLIEVTGWTGYPKKVARSLQNCPSGPTSSFSGVSKSERTVMLQSASGTPVRVVITALVNLFESTEQKAKLCLSLKTQSSHGSQEAPNAYSLK